MNLFPVILSLLVSLSSHVAWVIAADGPRPGFRPPSEVRAKPDKQRAQGVTRQTTAESEALYQFMIAEDRAGITVADRGSQTPSPRPR